MASSASGGAGGDASLVVGGVASSSVSVLSGPVTRTWTVSPPISGSAGAPASPKAYAVQLFHNTITGERTLSVDGVEVMGTSGTTGVLSSDKHLIFELPGGSKGEVLIENQRTGFRYSCSFCGAPVLEENNIVNGSGKGDTTGKLRIVVDLAELGADEGGKPVTWFRMRNSRQIDGAETVVHRRFRDFFAINEAVRSSYKGSHLLASFPEFPGRSFKFFQDHLAPDFVEKRRAQLFEWVNKVVLLPRVRTNTDFCTFLGLVDSIREVSVVFPGATPLGLELKQGREFVEVQALKALADGSPSPAQVSGLIKPGDNISKINGLDVLADSYDIVIAKLRAAGRPLIVHFLGRIPTAASSAEVPPPADFASVPMMPPPAIPLSAFVAAEPEPADEKAIGGLIGGGISYVGTGATPKPGAAGARKGIEHHAAATEAERAEAAFGGAAAPADFGSGGLL